MTAQDRKRLTQLSRRLTTAKARYRSLEKRAGLIEDGRTRLEEKARGLFDLLMSERGKRAGSKRRLSLAARFKKAKDEARRLRTIEDKIYEQLKEAEEKVSNLEDNMRKASKKNPGRKHLAGATAKQQRQYEHILESAKKYHRYGKRKKEVAARTVRAHGNPDLDTAGMNKLPIAQRTRAQNELMHWRLSDPDLKNADIRYHLNADKTVSVLVKGSEVARIDRKGKYVNPRRKNPTARQKLARAGRSVKRAVKATLGAGSKLLGAGAKAIKNAVNLKKFPDDKLQSYKADLESSLTKLRASGGGKATIRFVQGRINAVNRELKKRNPHKRIKVKNSYIDLVITGQAKKTPSGWKVGKKTFSQGRGTTKVSSGYYLDKATGFVYAKRERANPTRKGMRKGYRAAKRISKILRGRPGKSLTHYSPSESGQRKAARHEKRQTRKRNLDHRDSTHQVKVHQHWRAGGLSQWQRAHHAGQRPLFEHGIKVKPKRNASLGQYVGEYLGVKMYFAGSSYNAPSLKLFGYATDRQLQNAIRKKLQKKSNPSATAIRKKFAGRVTGAKTMYYAKGAPSGEFAKLGKLKLIKIKGGKILKPVRRNPSTEIWLCSDAHGKLWLASSRPGALYHVPAGDLGEVMTIEYEASKPHLGYEQPTIWYHHMGEEDGKRPHLYSNGQGDLLFKGGSYKLKREGITN